MTWQQTGRIVVVGMQHRSIELAEKRKGLLRKNGFRERRSWFRRHYAFLVDAIFFDEQAYLRENKDVAAAVQAGVFQSGYEHYDRYGRWEGRKYSVRAGFSKTPWLGVVTGFESSAWQLAARLNPWELWPRFRAEGRYVLSFRGGPSNMANYHAGPWVAPLLPWQRTTWVILEICLESQAERVQCVVQPLGVDHVPLGPSPSLFCRSRQVSKRVLRLPPGTTAVAVRCSVEGTPSRPMTAQIKPLTKSRARRLIVRRLGRATSDSVLEPGLSLDDLWSSYEATFPLAGRANYVEWRERVEAPEWKRWDERASAWIAAAPCRPMISLLVPTYNTNEKVLRECIESVLGQSYPDWQLCLVDDASTDPNVVRVLREYAAKDHRIDVRVRAVNGHISQASQEALQRAKGEWVGLLDHDDVLCRHALLQMVLAINTHPEARVFYSDEDKLDVSGRRTDPHFKPDFDPERLLGQNYVAHFLVAQREWVCERGGFRTSYEGSQDHDLVLRLTEGLGEREVIHVPWVLYHWRQSPGSTASSGHAKPYALEAGVRAVGDALARRGVVARVEVDEPGQCYRVRRAIADPKPLVSVIIPTRDGLSLLRRCLDTLQGLTRYRQFEVLVVDNGSREPATLRYLAELSKKEGVRVLRYDHPFNFSAINNFAVRSARGSLLAFLNNDIEVIEPDWLEELVSHAQRPEVGCVGAKLLYADRRIQHAGVVLGIGGVAGHAFKYAPEHSVGYFSRLRLTHSVSAVTAACLVVRRAVFEQVGGFDEAGLAVAFNDVDLCIRVRDAGYRNLLHPHSVLVHHESATRGSDHDPERRERFAREQTVMRERWGDALQQDPYYSPHLSLDYEDFSLRVR